MLSKRLRAPAQPPLILLYPKVIELGCCRKVKNFCPALLIDRLSEQSELSWGLVNAVPGKGRHRNTLL